MKRLPYAVFLASLCGSAVACSVSSPPSEKVIAEASSVFRARVTEVKMIQVAPKVPDGPREMLEVKFQVREKLKGAPPLNMLVQAHISQPGECGGFYVMVGAEYVMVINSGSDSVLSGSSFPLGSALPGLAARLDEFRKIAASKK